MKKKILCLMMAAILAVGAPLTAFARDYQGADGWQATFDGSKLNSNFKDEDVILCLRSSRVIALHCMFS